MIRTDNRHQTVSLILGHIQFVAVITSTLLCAQNMVPLFEQPARVIVPYLDAYITENSVGKQYPLSCKEVTRYCHRAHQVIYHERVLISQLNGDRARIRTPTCHWSDRPNDGCYYWVDARGLLAEHDIPAPEQAHLPTGQAGCPELVLIDPHMLADGTVLSVGTIARIERTSAHGHWIWLLDGRTKSCHLEYIPHHAARVCPSRTSAQHKRVQFFVDLIRHIAKPAPYERYIPYTWGGASATYRIARHEVIERENECFYAPHAQPASGFDCSGLIWRCAQAAQLNWLWRNTGMMYTHGKQLKRDTHCRNGDLIIWPGHVIIITDADHQQVSHAEGYTAFHGKGAIYTTDIDTIFQDIRSLKELKKKIDTAKSLTLASKNQKIITNARVIRITD
jgi:hypothetical protein